MLFETNKPAALICSANLKHFRSCAFSCPLRACRLPLPAYSSSARPVCHCSNRISSSWSRLIRATELLICQAKSSVVSRRYFVNERSRCLSTNAHKSSRIFSNLFPRERDEPMLSATSGKDIPPDTLPAYHYEPLKHTDKQGLE